MAIGSLDNTLRNPYQLKFLSFLQDHETEVAPLQEVNKTLEWDQGSLLQLPRLV